MPGEVLTLARTRILNKPMNMQLLGNAQPHLAVSVVAVVVVSVAGKALVEAVVTLSGERREGGRGDGRRLAANVVKAALRVVMILPVVVRLGGNRNHR
ncbi:hypothetical protein ACNKHU_19535 [Shigella flexneri]